MAYGCAYSDARRWCHKGAAVKVSSMQWDAIGGREKGDQSAGGDDTILSYQISRALQAKGMT